MTSSWFFLSTLKKWVKWSAKISRNVFIRQNRPDPISFSSAACTETEGQRGRADGWGTALQAGRSRGRIPMVSLEFFIDINLPVALWSWIWRHPLTEMSTRDISCGVKAAGVYGWQPYHLHVPNVLKSGSLNFVEPSGTVQACNGTAFTATEINSILWWDVQGTRNQMRLKNSFFLCCATA